MMRRRMSRIMATFLAITMLSSTTLYANAQESEPTNDTATIEAIETIETIEEEAEIEAEVVEEIEAAAVEESAKNTEETTTETTEETTVEEVEEVVTTEETVIEESEVVEEVVEETAEITEEETVVETTEATVEVETVEVEAVEAVAETTETEVAETEVTEEVAETETAIEVIEEVEEIVEEDEVLGFNNTDLIPIDEANFPDPAFRRYVSEVFDFLNDFPDGEGRVSKEGWLSYDELAGTASINNIYDYDYLSEVRNFKGLEHFKNLDNFALRDCANLTGELDLTGFVNLKHFEYRGSEYNGLTSVKLPNSVEHIDIEYSTVVSINIPSGVTYLNVRKSAYAIANPSMTIPSGIETFYGWEFLPMRDYTKYKSLTDMNLGTLEQARNGKMYGDTGVAEIKVRPQRFVDLAKYGYDLSRVVSCPSGSIENGILYPWVNGIGSYSEEAEFVYDFGINSENRYGLIKIWFDDNLKDRGTDRYCITNTADRIPAGNTSMDPTNPDNLYEYEGTKPSPTPTPSNPTPTPSNPDTPTNPDPSNKEWAFTDVAYKPGNWKYEAVKYITEKGVMKGVGDGTRFDPDAPLTREMFATVLYRMAGEPAVTYTNKFPDVPGGKWYSNAVIWASEKGIVSGYGSGNFGTGHYITREQIAKMLMEYCEKQGYDVSEKADFNTFADAGKVSGWANDYMKWAVGSGMIGGSLKDGKYYLNPKGNATRAESATMLKRFMEKY